MPLYVLPSAVAALLPSARPPCSPWQVWLVATDGEEGVPSLGDAVAAGSAGGELVGWVLFDVDGTVQWDSGEAFSADAAQHCVPGDSPYAFGAGGEAATVYGWRVVASHRLPEALPLPRLQRVLRSVYQVVP